MTGDESKFTDADIIELWEERRAIMEYDAGKTEQQAAKIAGIFIRRQFGTLPEFIREQIEALEKTCQ